MQPGELINSCIAIFDCKIWVEVKNGLTYIKLFSGWRFGILFFISLYVGPRVHAIVYRDKNAYFWEKTGFFLNLRSAFYQHTQVDVVHPAQRNSSKQNADQIGSMWDVIRACGSTRHQAVTQQFSIESNYSRVQLQGQSQFTRQYSPSTLPLQSSHPGWGIFIIQHPSPGLITTECTRKISPVTNAACKRTICVDWNTYLGTCWRRWLDSRCICLNLKKIEIKVHDDYLKTLSTS